MTASLGAQPPSSTATMDPETSRILSGAVGGVAGGFLTGGPVGAAIGAGVGGGTAALAQGHPEEAPAAALTQAGYESVGQLLAWPLQAVGRRLIASKVATNAAKYLEDTRVALNAKLDGVLASAKAAQRGTSEGVARARAAAGEAARTARAGVGDAQALADQRTAAATAAWPPPNPASYGPAGTGAADVIQGQGKHSLDQLGQHVERAAASGPDVNLTPVKARLEAMGATMRPSTAPGELPANVQAYLGANTTDAENATLVAKLKAAGVVGLDETHPLPGVLRQIQEAPDQVSFADAHKYKRMLDDATNWDSPAKKQVQQITKGIRGDLRGAMAGHAPYEAATKAYQDAIPLFRKGYAPTLVKSAIDNPTAIVKTIKPNEPLRLQMLHDVLTGAGPLDPTITADVEKVGGAAADPPTGGGHGAEGQQAWDAVRASIVHERLIKPGIEHFDASWAKFHPDSQKLLTSDPAGAQVIHNLQQMSEAYKASGLFEPGVEAAKGRAAAASTTAARTTEQGQIAMRVKARDTGAAQAQATLGKQPTPEEIAFQHSSLAHTPPPAQVASDILHAGAMHGMNVFRARSLGRLLLAGPKGADLIEWSSRSGPRTQAFIRAVTGSAPGMALANIARTAGIAMEEEPPMAPGHTPAATPPPAVVQAATPPPR